MKKSNTVPQLKPCLKLSRHSVRRRVGEKLLGYKVQVYLLHRGNVFGETILREENKKKFGFLSGATTGSARIIFITLDLNVAAAVKVMARMLERWQKAKVFKAVVWNVWLVRCLHPAYWEKYILSSCFSARTAQLKVTQDSNIFSENDPLLGLIKSSRVF